RRVLTIGVRMTDQEVRDRDTCLHISGLRRGSIRDRRVGIGEDTVVVQQRLLHILLQVTLRAEGERVLAECGVVDIAQAVNVGSGDRPADLVAKREEAAYGDLRKLR